MKFTDYIIKGSNVNENFDKELAGLEEIKKCISTLEKMLDPRGNFSKSLSKKQIKPESVLKEMSKFVEELDYLQDDLAELITNRMSELN